MVSSVQGMWVHNLLVDAVQVQGREGFPVKYTSVAQCGIRIVTEEGMGSFWRGSMCSFMKVRQRHTQIAQGV